LIFFSPSFLTGWWSLSGFLYTCYALAHNLLGGVDVTEQIEEPTTEPDRKKDISFAGKRLLLCILFIIMIMLPILAWLTFNFFK